MAERDAGRAARGAEENGALRGAAAAHKAGALAGVGHHLHLQLLFLHALAGVAVRLRNDLGEALAGALGGLLGRRKCEQVKGHRRVALVPSSD